MMMNFFKYIGHVLSGIEVTAAEAKRHFLEKEDNPRPLHPGDACGHFIDYFQRPYKVEQQYA